MDDFTELQRPLSGRRAPASRCSFVAALAVVGIVAFAAGALFTSAGSSAHLAKLAESPIPSPVAKGERFRKKLIFSDEFDFLDFTKWRHEISMSGGGNWYAIASTPLALIPRTTRCAACELASTTVAHHAPPLDALFQGV